MVNENDFIDKEYSSQPNYVTNSHERSIQPGI
jgi:hypothetical protein